MQFYNIYGMMYTKTGALFQREDRGTLYLPHRVEIKSHGHVYVYAISYLLTYLPPSFFEEKGHHN